MRKGSGKIARDKKFSIRANEELINKTLEKINTSGFLKYLFNFPENEIFTLSDLLELVAITIATGNNNLFNYKKSYYKYTGIVDPEEERKRIEKEEQRKFDEEYYKLRFQQFKKAKNK